jgi:hypothetical protein
VTPDAFEVIEKEPSPIARKNLVAVRINLFEFLKAFSDCQSPSKLVQLEHVRKSRQTLDANEQVDSKEYGTGSRLLQ